MIYTFGKNTEKELLLQIDSHELLENLKLFYSMSDLGLIQAKIKIVIKKSKEFYVLCNMFKMDKKELLVLLNELFPDLFYNKRTLSSLSKIYKDGNTKTSDKKKKRKYRKRNHTKRKYRKKKH